MTNLNTLSVTVNRFGVDDEGLIQQGLQYVSAVNYSFARTNTITALYTDDYTSSRFNCAIQFENMADNINAGNTAHTADLGVSNAIFADSLNIGRGRFKGSGNGFNITLPLLRVLPVLTNSVAPTAMVKIRNSDGVSPMSLFGAGVDTGSAVGQSTSGAVNFNGANLDMVVNQLWLGANRTNNTGAPARQNALEWVLL